MRNWLKTYHAQGHLAETIAAWMLRLKGYRIRKRRYKTPVGEIDLIAVRGQTLVAVEVKYRSSLEQTREAITLKQRKHIQMALALYVRSLRRPPENIRFDVIFLIPYKWPKHIVRAWIVDEGGYKN